MNTVKTKKKIHTYDREREGKSEEGRERERRGGGNEGRVQGRLY